MRALELRRHARRDPEQDRLSPEGRAQAEDVGRTLGGGYAKVFSSPTQRAAETVAWFLRGRGEPLPEHEVVPGLAGSGVPDTPEGLGEVVRDLLSRVPADRRALGVGHTPLIEKSVLGLTGRRIDPLQECEGVLITLRDDDGIEIEELRG